MRMRAGRVRMRLFPEEQVEILEGFREEEALLHIVLPTSHLETGEAGI
jgi:hypothetical protein